jgi:hypothetical protein
LHNKLECLSLANIASLVYCLWVMPGAYRRERSFVRVGNDKRSSLI